MKQKLYITTALLIGILFILNLLSNEFHLRLDLTSEGQYTLSDATLDILHDLEDPVTVKAYFSTDLPPNIVKTRQDFQEMLIEYANRADGLIQYEFINPNEKESTENEAVQNGIQPVMINIREKDQMKQQKAFLGATLSLGDRKEVIPFLQPGAAMEYALTTAIKKISVTEKPTIGFVQGHGEPPLSDLVQVQAQLNVLYNTEQISLTDTTAIPDRVKTLALIRPMDSIPPSHLQRLDDFLSKSGKLVIAMNRVNGDLQNANGYAVTTGLEAWLQQKGIVVEDNFVVDAKCGTINVVQQQGSFSFQTQMSFPYLPLVGKFADHPISKGLESVLFEFASTIYYNGDTTKKFTPLALTSEQSSALKAPQYFNIQKQWTQTDLPQRNLTMAAAVEGKLSGNTVSKLVIIADGDFAVTGPQQSQQRRPADNISLFTNSIDWLSDDTGLITLRTKGVTSRPIDQLEDSTKVILKYTNFLLPILLVIGYGLVRMQQNRIRRFKRMSENYEEA
jgi:gliding-associated putative ABC transporter substrate-binding component GldG